jgi:hypothetical protein
MNRAECKAACRLHLIIVNWHNIGTGTYQVKKVGLVPAYYIKSCTVLGKRCAKWYLLLSNNNPTFLEQWTNGGIFKENGEPQFNL